MKRVDFLDVTLDLMTGLYMPYIKPNNVIMYVHNESNHPPIVLKNIPDGVNQRLSNISANEDIFSKAIPQYQEALQKSGYTYKLHYSPTPLHDQSKNRSRKRNVLWYNPPFSKNVSTNIGKKFLSILDKCFHKENPLSKVFNRNTVKISFSTMPNIGQIISGHNQTVLRSEGQENNKTSSCNCRRNTTCPVDGKCNTKGVIYQATVERKDTGELNKYIGLCDTTFKIRLASHKNSFKDKDKRKSTKLSDYIWDLQLQNCDFELSWKIVSKASSYSPSSKICNLCNREIYYILYKPEMANLNKRNELMSACRHKWKFKLENQK